jgi:hypothetical protein
MREITRPDTLTLPAKRPYASTRAASATTEAPA